MRHSHEEDGKEMGIDPNIIIFIDSNMLYRVYDTVELQSTSSYDTLFNTIYHAYVIESI